MPLSKIQVFDHIKRKEIVEIPLSSRTTVRMICRDLNPYYELEEATLYYNVIPLCWDSTFEYIENKYSLLASKVLLFNFRYYDFGEVMKILQLNERELKELIDLQKLNSHGQGEQTIFRVAEIERYRLDQMEFPTSSIESRAIQRELEKMESKE